NCPSTITEESHTIRGLSHPRRAMNEATAAAQHTRSLGGGYRLAAIRAARRIAAIMLVGLATPWPAMSKAGPWAGEGRMIGRPGVRFTAVSNSISLIGMWP